MVQKDSKSYLSTYEFRFHIITRFLTSTGFALGFRFTSFLVTNHSVSFQPRKRAREGRKFSLFVRIHESVEGESGQGWPLSRAPPALVRCHWAHATRSLACQAIITVLATARVRAVSLSRRKATDQVNIANRCIVASVNSISRPTDSASLRSLPLSSASAGYNKSTFFFFLPFFILLEKKDPFDSRSSWTVQIYREYAQVSSMRLDFDTKITEVELTVFVTLSKSSPFIENVDERRQIAGFHLTPSDEDAFFLPSNRFDWMNENQLAFLFLSLQTDTV